jgi:DNA (cytosine-5)-methyltransferase 1
MSQMSIFDGSQPLKITKPIRLIECFAGYGSQALALKYLGVDFEHWKIAEWAVKSIQAYKDMHFPDDNTDYSAERSKEWLIEYLFEKGISADYNKPMTREQIARMGEDKIRTVYNNIIATHNLVSVTNVNGKDLDITNTDDYTYILTYSFPCQDLSQAGLSKGMQKGSGTRSGLLWEIERILDECEELPQILLMENVPQVIGVKNRDAFHDWFMKLESIGYKSYYTIMNSRDYGIPQNRDRLFVVSVLGDFYYNFPKKKRRQNNIKEFLEKTVPCSYYNVPISMLKAIDKKQVYIVTERGFSQTVTCKNDRWHNVGLAKDDKGIRYLTEREVFRLMGVKDFDFDRIYQKQNKISLYHLAGDSIVTNCLMSIFKQML